MRIRLRLVATAAFVLGAGMAAPSYALQAATSPDGLLDEAQSVLVTDPGQGLELARRARMGEKGLPAPRDAIVLRAGWLEGEALLRLGNETEAARVLKETLAAAGDAETAVYGKLLIANGRVGRAMGESTTALSSFQDAYRIFEKLGNRRYQAIALQGLSTLYSNAQQYERAIAYDRRAAEVYGDDPMILLASLNNRGAAYRHLGEFARARALFKEALESDVATKLGAAGNQIDANLAVLELSAGNLAGVEEAVARIEARIGETKGLTMPLVAAAARAEVARRGGAGAEALAILDEAFRGIDLTTTSADALEAHTIAYEIYREGGRTTEALGHIEAAKRLGDIAKDVAASANLAILNAEFELSNKELEIANLRSSQLETEVALIEAERQKEKLLGAFAIFAALGLSGFFTLQTVQARRNRRVTEAMNVELEKVNAKLRLSNTELEKASAAKTEFLATTSHEVRTPLNAVINLTQSVIDTGGTSEEARGKLRTALRSAEHLHEIVSDVLDVARFEGGRVNAHLSLADVGEIVRDVTDLWRPKAEEKGLDFVLASDPAPKGFVTDEKLLRQVLSNLLSNAIKFTPKGSVSLSVSGGGAEPLSFRVSDTGIGIAPEDQRDVFESFRQIDRGDTRNYGGTGLGLAICRQITELLGGRILLDSTPDVGTSLEVTLPAKGEDALAKSRGAPGDRPLPKLSDAAIDRALAGVRVLAAEDNAVNAMVIRTLLKDCVDSLVVVGDGQEAVEAVRAGGFDVVLMDKQMPVMDGVEATRRIRALAEPCAAIPIIAVTADAFSAAKEELFAAGANDYLAKPIKPADLKRAIVTNLAAAETPAEGRQRAG